MQKLMIKAAKSGDVEAIRQMIAADSGLVHARDTDDSTPLHYAAWKGYPELAEVLLDAGADPNAENTNGHWGTTPLHAAAHSNRPAIIELLLARGAKIDARDANGATPLKHTEAHKATAAAKLLRLRGAAE